jgi:hypothetical protein
MLLSRFLDEIYPMKRAFVTLVVIGLMTSYLSATNVQADADGRIRVLIIDGRHNHDWQGYELHISDDGKKWSAPIASGVGHEAVTKISFEPAMARFINIIQTGKSDHHRWSVSQFWVHGQLTK